ncbi:MAG: hypothetical protein WBQ41_09745 [Solirubrobacterales bacterium]
MTTTAKRNGRPLLCEILDCTAEVHGRGLCRIHFDEQRYLRTTGKSAEAVEVARREQAILDDLRLGGVAEWMSPHGTNSMFATDEERRAAWEERKDELMSEYLTARSVGHRPGA